MANEIGELRKELAKVRQELSRIEYRISYLELELLKLFAEDRVKILEKEINEAYPNLKVDREILELVGIQPYNPVEKDKEIIREAVSERYG